MPPRSTTAAGDYARVTAGTEYKLIRWKEWALIGQSPVCWRDGEDRIGEIDDGGEERDLPE